MATRRRARKPRLGSGKRFAAGVAAIKARNRKRGTKTVRNPAAVMAKAGRKKYGKARMAKMSAAGRRRKARKRR